MSGSETAAIITAISGLFLGVFAAIRQIRTDRATDDLEQERQDNEEAALLLNGYSNMVEDLRREVNRLQKRVQELEDKHEREKTEWHRERESLKEEVRGLHRELASYIYRNPTARTRREDDGDST